MYQPSTKTRNNVSATDLREFGDFTKNFVLDYKPVTVLSFPSILAAGPLAVQSLGNGNAPIIDINTSDIGGMSFATADIHGFKVPLPYGMDADWPVGFRAKWLKVQAIAAGTGACLWGLSYNAVQVGITPTAVGATALVPPIVNQVDLAQYVEQWTTMGVIPAGALSALTPGDDCLDCSLLATLDTITDGTLTELQMWFHPRVL